MADTYQTLQLTNFSVEREPQLYYDDPDGQFVLKNDLIRAISSLRPGDFDPDAVVLQVDRLTGVDQGQVVETLLAIDWNDIDLPSDDDESDDDGDYNNHGPELTSQCQARIDALFE